ncbi:MAG: ATP phosphoribosyltransferase [Synergistetes bacterium]|nr:MAG: ATP phosphoribosyltransferase [bacterium 42_11]MBC7332781.1 ATP phosphoribosyltransferase [Synergistota bacterium]MDK2871404.1 phosphoribosyltransferase [bacterium]
MKKNLSIALPTGRLLKKIVELLKEKGILEEDYEKLSKSRKLIFERNGFRLILAKPFDIPIYVSRRAADLGIAGNDVIWERKEDVYEIADLGIGKCELVLAAPADKGLSFEKELLWGKKLGTKYPKIAEDFLNYQGIQMDIVKLYGSVEIAPLVNLVDVILDLKETGRTLKENNLVIIKTIAQVSARLIVNPVCYKNRTNEILEIASLLEGSETN